MPTRLWSTVVSHDQPRGPERPNTRLTTWGVGGAPSGPPITLRELATASRPDRATASCADIYWRLVRYAAMAFACSSLRPRSGIFAPGLSRCGSRTHAATLAGVFGHLPAASMVRPPKWLRFGPSTPPDTPAIVWQPTHALLAKIALPSAARPAGSAGAALLRAPPASNSAGARPVPPPPLFAVG